VHLPFDLGSYDGLLASQHRLDEASYASQVAQKVEVGMPKFALILL